MDWSGRKVEPGFFPSEVPERRRVLVVVEFSMSCKSSCSLWINLGMGTHIFSHVSCSECLFLNQTSIGVESSNVSNVTQPPKYCTENLTFSTL